eukprot:5210610-Pleurochrysis_carterae.AAC.1
MDVMKARNQLKEKRCTWGRIKGRLSKVTEGEKRRLLCAMQTGRKGQHEQLLGKRIVSREGMQQAPRVLRGLTAGAV